MGLKRPLLILVVVGVAALIAIVSVLSVAFRADCIIQRFIDDRVYPLAYLKQEQEDEAPNAPNTLFLNDSALCVHLPANSRSQFFNYTCSVDKARLQELVQLLHIGPPGLQLGLQPDMPEEERSVEVKSVSTLPATFDTKYVLLIPKDVTSVLDGRASIRRLVEVAEATRAAFVGGAFVYRGDAHDIDGRKVWELDMNTCVARVRYSHWQMQFTTGYKTSSLLDCRQCALALGPVLVRASVLKKTPVRDLPNGYGLLEDLQLRNQGAGAWSCPDVLFRVHRLAPDARVERWWPFFKQWDIERFVTDRHGVVIDAKCDDSALRLPRRDWATGRSMTPCEMVDYCHASTCTLLGAQNHSIYLYHSDGNGLGSIKFNGMPLPWEGDFDAFVEPTDLDVFFSALPNITSTCGLRIESMDRRKRHAVVRGPMETKVDVWTGGNAQQITGNEGHDLTRERYCGYLVNVPRNPGRFHIDRYGPGIFRHASNWWWTGEDGSEASYSAGIEKGEGMIECWSWFKDHNACLGGLADGDLKEEYPWEFVLQYSLERKLQKLWS